MKHISSTDARTHFHEYARRAARGETFVICRRGVPIVRMRPLSKKTLTDLRAADRAARARLND